MPFMSPPPSRRRFLLWLAGLGLIPAWAARAAAGGSGSPGGLPLPGGADSPLALRRRPPEPSAPLVPFPGFAATGRAGAGTFQAGHAGLFTRALQQGVRLVSVSPDYRKGELESWVGRALRETGAPAFVMTQIPVEAWSAANRRIAFERALEQSLGRLGRDRVEALLVRNAEPGQLVDPDFRAFAADVRRRGLVGRIGASGHGPDVEKILERAPADDLVEIVLYAGYLSGFRTIPDLLPRARAAGVLLVAMKAREAALWSRAPGWEREAERRRFAPWLNRWDPEFTRRAVARALDGPAHNVVLGVRHPEDLAAILDPGKP